MTEMISAFSSCPNDTFIFHALLHGAVDTRGFCFSHYISDVEELNAFAAQKRFPLTKLSFHAYLRLKSDYTALDAGSALGFGCGPLLIAPEGSDATRFPDRLEKGIVAVPGEYTTANLLLRLWNPSVRTISVRFDRIMPGVQAGEYDAGVIIHEGRFIYPSYGLSKIVDLGEWWEAETGLPIPLGCIALRNDFLENYDVLNRIMGDSVRYAMEHPLASREFVKAHAQEMDDAVIDEHIRLYVNEFTLRPGDAGMKAAAKLEEMARCRRIIP